MFGIKKKITYALGGGGAYGFSHIGAIKYLESLSIYPSAICGTSIGALIGGLYAYGMKIEEIENLAKEFNRRKVMNLFFRPGITKGGFLDSYKIKDFLYEYIGDVNIADLRIPFIAVACDSKTGEEIDIHEGLLIDAILASISIPAVFVPYYHNDIYFVDGGICNNVPMDIASHFSKYVIGINVQPVLKEECIDESKNKKDIVKQIKKQYKKLKPLNLAEEKNIEVIQNLEKENHTKLKHYDKIKKEKHTLVDSINNVISIHHQRELKKIKTSKRKILINIKNLEQHTMADFHKSEEIIKIGYDCFESNDDKFKIFI